MFSIESNKADCYRKRAEEARAKAETMREGPARQALLNDAALWEKMASYEEKRGAQR